MRDTRPKGRCRLGLGGFVLLVFPAHAGGAELDATVAAGGGYDSNALLEIRPASEGVQARGAFASLEPTLTLTLRAGRLRAFAGYDGLLRQSPSFGFVAWNTADAGLAYYGATTRLSLALGAAHFMATNFSEEAFFGYGPQLALSTALTDRLRLQANLVVQWRQGDTRLRRLDGAVLSLRYRWPAAWSLGARTAWMALASDASSLALPWWRLRAGPFAQFDDGDWKLEGFLGPFLGLRHLDGYTAGQAGVVASVDRALAWGLGLRASVDVTREWGPLEAGRADRLEALLAFTWQGSYPGRSRRVAPADRPSLAPRIEGGRVKFSLHAPAAQTVRVLGSFDDWGAGRALQPGGNGLWQAWVDLPPGRHRYRFLVDDVPVKPPESPRYVPDGFGGIDGEIEVGNGRGVSHPRSGSL